MKGLQVVDLTITKKQRRRTEKEFVIKFATCRRHLIVKICIYCLFVCLLQVADLTITKKQRRRTEKEFVIVKFATCRRHLIVKICIYRLFVLCGLLATTFSYFFFMSHDCKNKEAFRVGALFRHLHL